MRYFPIFGEGISMCVGKGDRTKFWKDKWCSDSPLASSFPHLFRCAVNQEATVADYLSLNENSVSWSPLLRRNLFDWELDDFLELMSLLLVQKIDVLGEDLWCWKWKPDGVFSVKSMADKLDNVGGSESPARQIWNPLSPSKANFLVWTMALDKCLSRSNLLRRGIPIPDASCVLCGTVEESTEHLYLHCPFSLQIWLHSLKALGANWVLPRSVKDHLCSWKLNGLSKRGKLMWKTIPAAILRSIWAERNSRIFCNRYKDVDHVIQRAVGKLISWISTSGEFRGLGMSVLLQSCSWWRL
ncbi:PREDICTED: uncharacterized protein LOC104591337 [Nelumbo nucifera]|uniref:Uncharacterized protein LOC104591337 n=1 Tax=Nelumbo nucifera TaxID=4432 RepID=A0A1U7ZB98_NELNU|nr:PREDICTED: uncharacterized protein LOC104591337 [Nelumbo nucifera]